MKLLRVVLPSCAIALLLPAGAGAATIDVNTQVDESGNAATTCSLRDAVQTANLDVASGGCTAVGGFGGDVINVPAGTYTLSLTGAEGGGNVQVNDIDVDDEVTIQNDSVQPAVIDANGISGVFQTDAAGDGATLVGLTITGGSAFSGAGILNSDVLTVRNSTIVDNFATSQGGGIAHFGASTTLTNVTISGNRANADGGGIHLDVGGVVSLQSVTVSNNTADADISGFGNGGGISRQGGSVALRDTLLAGNIDGGGQAPDCSGTINSNGNNLVGTTAGCTFGAQPTDLPNKAPMTGPLADNGGPTQTHALLTGSEAIDAGSAGAPTTDQRGLPRAGTADIGAYELTLCSGVAVNRIGTAGNDSLLGTAGADGFLADAGNDVASGLGGNDALCGSGGNDTLKGGAGNDKALGEAGKDKLVGGAGKDRLVGAGGKDRLLGQGGADVLLGGPGADNLIGGPGRDKLKGGPGRDRQRQ
jgi:CSLREA domain-containing protein